MKKIVILTVMSLIYQAYALFGVGLHLGADNTNVKSESVTAMSITISDVEYSYRLERDAIRNPLAFGAQIYLDIPIIPIGFEVGFEGAWASYYWRGANSLTGPDGDIELRFPGYDFPVEDYEEKFEFARVGVDITGKWYIFSLPPVIRTFKFYVGGGAGFYFITPVISENFIKSELEKGTLKNDIDLGYQTAGFDIDDKLEKATVFGTHIVAGMQLKIPIIPISFNVDYKYVMADENQYGDNTNKFSVIKGSFNLYF